MKTKLSLALLATIALFQLAPSALAEPAAGQEFRRHGRHERLLANLSPDERAKLRAAHTTAMTDPAVQAAKDRKVQAARDFRDLRRAAMLRADPTIQPILDKIPTRDRRS